MHSMAKITQAKLYNGVVWPCCLCKGSSKMKKVSYFLFTFGAALLRSIIRSSKCSTSFYKKKPMRYITIIGFVFLFTPNYSNGYRTQNVEYDGASVQAKLDKAIWLNATFANSNMGDAVATSAVLDWMIFSGASPDQFNNDSIRKVMLISSKAYQENLYTAQGIEVSSKKTAFIDYVSEISGLAPIGPVPGPIVVSGLKQTWELVDSIHYDLTWKDRRIEGQDKITGYSVASLEKQREVFSKFYDLAMKNPEFKEAFNRYFADRNIPKIGESGRVILQKYQGLANSIKLAKLQEAMEMGQKELIEFLKKEQKKQSDYIVGKTGEAVQRFINNNKLKLSQEETNRQKWAEKVNHHEFLVKETYAFNDIITTFIPDPRRKQAVRMGFSAAIQFWDTTERMNFPEGMGKIGTMAAMSNYLGATMMVANALQGNQEKKETQQVMKMLKNISEKLDQLEATMITRFDQIDHKLSKMYQNIMDAFSKIHNDIISVKKDTETIINNLEDAELRLIIGQRNLYERLYKKTLDNVLARAKEDRKDDLMDPDLFFNAIFESGRFGVDLAKKENRTRVDLLNSKNVYEALNSGSVFPENAGYILEQGRIKYGANITQTDIPNVKDWLTGVRAFLNIYDAWPQYHKYAKKNIDEYSRKFFEEGHYLRTRLSNLLYIEGKTVNKIMIKKIFDAYKNNLKNNIELVNKYSASVNGVNPFGPADYDYGLKAPSLKSDHWNTVRHCGNNPNLPHLNLTQDLNSIVPPIVRNAEALLKQNAPIDICYEYVHSKKGKAASFPEIDKIFNLPHIQEIINTRITSLNKGKNKSHFNEGCIKELKDVRKYCAFKTTDNFTIKINQSGKNLITASFNFPYVYRFGLKRMVFPTPGIIAHEVIHVIKYCYKGFDNLIPNNNNAQNIGQIQKQHDLFLFLLEPSLKSQVDIDYTEYLKGEIEKKLRNSKNDLQMAANKNMIEGFGIRESLKSFIELGAPELVELDSETLHKLYKPRGVERLGDIDVEIYGDLLTPTDVWDSVMESSIKNPKDFSKVLDTIETVDKYRDHLIKALDNDAIMDSIVPGEIDRAIRDLMARFPELLS